VSTQNHKEQGAQVAPRPDPEVLDAELVEDAQLVPDAPAPVTPAPLGTASTAEAGVSGRTSTGAPAGILDDLAIHLFLTGHALPGLPSAIPTGVVFDVPVPPGRVAAS